MVTWVRSVATVVPLLVWSVPGVAVMVLSDVFESVLDTVPGVVSVLLVCGVFVSSPDVVVCVVVSVLVIVSEMFAAVAGIVCVDVSGMPVSECGVC